jgi:hypothetical protein
LSAPAPAELDLAFTWSLRDYVRAQRAILLSRELIVITLVAVPALVLIVLAVATYMRTQNIQDFGIDPQVLQSLALTMLPVVALAEWVILAGWFNVSGGQQRRTDRNLQFPIHHVYSQYGLMVKGKASQLTLGWKSISRIVETKDFFLFYYSGTAAYFLPKRDLAVPDLEALRRVIMAHRSEVADLREHSHRP